MTLGPLHHPVSFKLQEVRLLLVSTLKETYWFIQVKIEHGTQAEPLSATQ